MPNLPYAQRIATLEKMLEKIQTAAEPATFSQDFVSTKLGMKGGTPRSIIPFIKKMGLVSSDGSPTDRYRQFRNVDKAGYAIADSMREVYATLFEMNEYVNELGNAALKGLIVEATGAEEDANTVEKTLSTFNALKNMADFSETSVEPESEQLNPIQSTGEKTTSTSRQESIQVHSGEGINLSYTINLNLPATKDIEVFNAIFKSLKDHLLKG